MVTLSLDTSQIVDLLRRRDPGAKALFDAQVLSGQPLMVSAPVRHELVSGASSSASPDRRLVQLANLLAQCSQVEFSPADAEASGRLSARLRISGKPIGDVDTLIAGQALARGWTVVTRNVRHFGRVEGLPLIDWSVSRDPLSAAAIALRVEAAARS
jgi:tRNA(fMet)-specific endonuclease VapC